MGKKIGFAVWLACLVLISPVWGKTPDAAKQTIVLIRHAKVEMNPGSLMNASRAMEYLSAYDRLPIESFEPNTVLVKLPKPLPDTIYTSTLYRSKETARRLFGDSASYVHRAIFDEFDLRIVRLPLLLPLRAWTVISRFAWVTGLMQRDVETHKEAMVRIAKNCDWLEERTAADGYVLMVTHGFLNHSLKRELKRRGWTVEYTEGHGNLGVQKLVKL